MLSLHTITTKPWSADQCIAEYAAAGVGGITFWRHDLEHQKPKDLGQRARDAGLAVTGLARGGFFPAADEEGLMAAIEDNLWAIEATAELGAPVLVLVCGAIPGKPLDDSRAEIAEGISRILPFASEAGVKLAIEPLHPMYADDRSAINSMAQANSLCDHLGSPPDLGIAVDTYHTWWDHELDDQIAIAGEKNRLFAFHIADWLTPTTDLLNDRGLPGEGCIDIPHIAAQMKSAGFTGPSEVEIFSDRHWSRDQDKVLQQILAYKM